MKIQKPTPKILEKYFSKFCNQPSRLEYSEKLFIITNYTVMHNSNFSRVTTVSKHELYVYEIIKSMNK